MTVEAARAELLYLWAVSVYHPRGCRFCAARGEPAGNHWASRVEAASIAYDLVVAEASIARIRASVAW